MKSGEVRNIFIKFSEASRRTPMAEMAKVPAMKSLALRYLAIRLASTARTGEDEAREGNGARLKSFCPVQNKNI